MLYALTVMQVLYLIVFDLRKSHESWNLCTSAPRKKEKKIWLAFRPSCTVYYCQKWKLHFLENFLDINAYYVIFNFHFCMCKIVYSFIFYVISFHFTLYQEESKLSIYIFLDIRVVIKVWDKGNIKVSSLWFQPPFLL